jgi:hypothetical protein
LPLLTCTTAWSQLPSKQSVQCVGWPWGWVQAGGDCIVWGWVDAAQCALMLFADRGFSLLLLLRSSQGCVLPVR